MTRPSAETVRQLAQAASIDDWHWQLGHAICSVGELERYLSLTAAERTAAARAEHRGLRWSITPYVLNLCHPQDPTCPIRRQFLPSCQEDDPAPGDDRDPLGEQVHEVADGLIRRYEDRALLIVSHSCPAYCRFCTRSRLVGKTGGVRSLSQLEPALSYLRSHPDIRELILSGGDPLTLGTPALTERLALVRSVPHIEVIRLATRACSTLPQRITEELIRDLRPFHPLWVMTHFNHPREITPQAERACLRLVDGGFPLMNQTVLLRGVNDQADVLTELFRALLRLRVRPYYLLQADPVWGTAHLRTPLQIGIGLMEQLQGRLSGIALPKFIVDSPGGLGKVPVGPNYVLERRPGLTRLRTHRGAEVEYVDPPEPTRSALQDEPGQCRGPQGAGDTDDPGDPTFDRGRVIGTPSQLEQTSSRGQ